MSVSRYDDYDRLASVYNRHLSHFPELVLPVLEQLLLRRLPARASVLDLCCGTGQLAGFLGQRGYQVTGVDGSEQMLRFARDNAPAAELVVADARDFCLPRRFDAAVSVFDSMNHILSAEDLAAVFARVFVALQAGGLFVFDLNMEPAFATRWNGCFRAVDGAEVCEIHASWDAETMLGCNLATFYRRADGRRMAEIAYLEKCYDEAEVRSALARAGFVTVSCYDAQRDLGIINEFGRSFFVATA